MSKRDIKKESIVKDLQNHTVLEISTNNNKQTKLNNKADFESYKIQYKGLIDDKCIEQYGSLEDKDLWEDTAKELFIQSENFIPDEDVKPEKLGESKTSKEFRIIDTSNNKVLKVFSASEEAKGYEEMRKMGDELKSQGKEDNLIYREFRVKNKDKQENLKTNTKKKMDESVNWSYYDKFKSIEDKYLPVEGQGDTFATQIVTAITKLVYKWYNDGDVYDNVMSGMNGWANDLSSYANWLYEYVDGTQEILMSIEGVSTDSEYEDLLKKLADEFLAEEFLEQANNSNKQGDIYECDGPFEFDEHWDDKEEDDWEEDTDDDYDEDDLDESKKLSESITIGDLLEELDSMTTVSEINVWADKFVNDMDKNIVNAEIEAIEQEYPDVYEMDEDSEEYEDIVNELKSCIESDFSGEEDTIVELTKINEDKNKNQVNRRLPNISKFIYDLDVHKGNAWSVQSYTKDGRGNKIIIVSRNGKSENTAKDIKKTVEDKYNQLQGEITENGAGVWFYLKPYKTEVYKKQVGDGINVYNWDDSDVDYIKSLVGDAVTVRIDGDMRTYGNVIDLKLAPTDYIDSGIVNFTRKFYDDVEAYIKSKYPEAELGLNNTGSTIWIRESTKNGSDKVSSKLESKKLQEGDTYDSGIFQEIEEAFEDAGLNPRRFIDEGVLTKNIGWTLYSDKYGSQQISCDGSWYDPEDEEDELDESKKLKEGLYDRTYNTDDRYYLKELALNGIYVANKDEQIYNELVDRMTDEEQEEYKEYLEKFKKAPYDFVANNYTTMPIELLKEIARNAIYVANDDEAIENEMDYRENFLLKLQDDNEE